MKPRSKISKPLAATQVYRLVVRRRFGVSERRACRVLKQRRSTQSYVTGSLDDEERLIQDMIERARQYGLYCYRRVAAMLIDAGM